MNYFSYYIDSENNNYNNNRSINFGEKNLENMIFGEKQKKGENLDICCMYRHEHVQYNIKNCGFWIQLRNSYYG